MIEVAIIGAGMAGASLAAELSGAVEVLILEAESQPGYHATGRSAAFWSESYGGPLIQPLTSRSRSVPSSSTGTATRASTAGRNAAAAER